MTYQRRLGELETTIDLPDEEDVSVLINYRIMPAQYKDEQDELESFTVTRMDDFSCIILDKAGEDKIVEAIWNNEYD